MLTDAIEDAGMTVLVARDGEQALAMIERITPDVILMDAVMPGIDGFETCRQLKRNQALSHVPIIFMTGLSETEDIVKGLEAGGVDYVTKPIVPEELLARIRVHLANARMSQSARAALDVFGRFLLAANRAGRVLWCTPQAAKLLRAALPEFRNRGLHGRRPTSRIGWRACRRSNVDGVRNDRAVDRRLSPIKLEIVLYRPDRRATRILLRLIEGDPAATIR